VTSPRRLLLAKEIRTVFTQTPLLIAALLGLGLPWVTQGQINPLPFVYAERFGVVNIIPNDQSGETGQDAEPSIAVGTGTHNGEFIVRAFRSGSNTRYYNSTDKGIHWITWPIDLPDIDGTIDWASGGTAYETDLTDKFGILAHNFFYGNLSYIPNSEYRPYYRAVDQPWLKAVTVNGVDHVYIGYNDFSEPNGRSASVRFFVDAGQTWGSCIVEKVTPNPINGHKQDSPAVRLAISPDGNTVYALFQEWNWGIGTDPNGDPIDRIGNIVVVRDDNVACTFDAVGSHAYADFYANLPWETSLGAQRIGSACDIALNPSNPNEVYEAHTRLSYATGLPSIVVARSQAGGGAGTFVGLREFKNASLPALAVTKDGTFGMLFAQMDGVNLKVMFWKSPKGDFNFNMGVLKTLAVWPNNNPGKIGNIYVGDYFQLKADGYNFYGTFCASGDPKCSNFPSGVYYQRNVNVAGVTKNNFWLKQDGGLVDLGGNSISPSIDPFFFYDIASTFVDVNVAVAWNNASAQAAPDDPFAGRNHFNWAVLPASSPQFQLESSLALGSSASWTIETNNLIQTNGQFYLAPDLTHPRQYFRLRQNVAGPSRRLLPTVTPLISGILVACRSEPISQL